MTTFLHIGLPKAASTFLQSLIFPQALPRFLTVQEMRQQWPWMWDLNPYRPGLPQPTVKPGSQQGTFQEQEYGREGLSPSRTPSLQDSLPPGNESSRILSLEGLCGSSWNPASNSLRNAEVISDAFSDVRVLLVVRRQDHWFQSIWRQLVVYENRFGKYLTPDEFRRTSGLGASLTELDWGNLVLSWAEFFGLQRITVVPFELLRQQPDVFITEIGNWLGSVLPIHLGARVVDPQKSQSSSGFRPRMKHLRHTVRRKSWLATSKGGTWPELSPELKAFNRSLSSLMDRDFQEFGY